MIHFISSRDRIGSRDCIGSSILTLLVFTIASVHRCQVITQVALQTCNRSIEKSCLDLLYLSHMTQCHVSCAISSFIITCMSFATSLSHFHLYGICCSHTYTCGLITCVSHINTINPPRLSLNYQNQTRTFQSPPFW